MRSHSFIKIELLLITSILAFCSIVYELLLSNTLAIVTGSYVWWQTLTVAVFIGGLGLGAYLSEKIKNYYQVMVRVELALSFLGAICVVYVYLFHGAFKFFDTIFFLNNEYYSPAYLQNVFFLKILFFLIIQTLTLSIGILSGFEIPLMMKIAHAELGENEKEEHYILGVNYIGTLVGTICFAYFLLPKLDVVKAGAVVATINLFVSLYFNFKYVDKFKKIYYAIAAAVFVVVGAIGFSEAKITQNYLHVFYYLPKILETAEDERQNLIKTIKELPKIERMKSLYQYVDIFKYPHVENGVEKEATILTLDTNFQFNTATEYLYHQSFAHVSIAINKTVPKKVLVLGGGDGLLIRELLKYPQIESINHIELDQKIIDLANTRFAELNQHSLSNPRVHSSINDGFYFVRNTHEKFDAVFIDFPYPNSYDLLRLYSVEFYTYVKNVLNPDGFVVLDAPFYNKVDYTKERYRGQIMVSQVFGERHILSNSVLASTFYYAGFRTLFPYRIADESFLFVKADSGKVDYEYMENADLSKLDKQTLGEMKEIKNQDFPYYIAYKYVNSIFKPTLTRKNEF